MKLFPLLGSRRRATTSNLIRQIRERKNRQNRQKNTTPTLKARNFPQAPISKPNNLSNREFLFYKPLKEFQQKYNGKTVEGNKLTNDIILTYAKFLALKNGPNASNALPGVTSRGIKYNYWKYNNEPLRMLLINSSLGSPAGIMRAGKETVNRFKWAKGIGLSASEGILRNIQQSVANEQRRRNNLAAQKNLQNLEVKHLKQKLARLKND